MEKSDKVTRAGSTGISNGRRLNLLIVAVTKVSCGNRTTARRIGALLRNIGHVVFIKDYSELSSDDEVLSFVQTNRIDVCLPIHLLKCAHILSTLPAAVKVVGIFGGTDLNVSVNDEANLSKITNSVRRTVATVAFSEAMRDKATDLWPFSRCIHAPQGVTTRPSQTFVLKEFLSTNHGVAAERVYLLVSNIRPVKDPMYLFKEFTDWHLNIEANKDSFLVIAGESLDTEYFEMFKQAVDSSRGVIYIGSLPQPDLHAAISQCSALVNSSLSEGMCGAILEAFDLSTLAIARGNEGNSSLVTHRENGLLYNTEKEFIEAIEYVQTHPESTYRMIEKAKSTASLYTEQEIKQYVKLLECVCDDE